MAQALPLMPKATAVWLIDNTALSFEQIADFCGLHPLEVKGIADGEVAIGIVGLDPIANNQLTREEIERCEKDEKARLALVKTDAPKPVIRSKGARYTPVSKRQDKPDAVAWLIKFHPEVPDASIAKLIGTTKATITAVRDRSHWNAQNIKPHDPVSLGLCSQLDLDRVVQQAARRLANKQKRDAAAQRRVERETQSALQPTSDDSPENLANAVNDEGGQPASE